MEPPEQDQLRELRYLENQTFLNIFIFEEKL